jgi:hypothetical protein
MSLRSRIGRAYRELREPDPTLYIAPDGTMSTGTKEASDPSVSMQPRFHNDTEQAFMFMSYMAQLDDQLPPFGTKARDAALRKFWRTEPILAGAVSSMVQKMVALNWTVTGGRNKVRAAADVLYNAEDGAGWNVYLGKVTQDYLSQSFGSLTEKGMYYRGGPVVDIYQIDSARVDMTGLREYPFVYTSPLNGRQVKINRDDVFHMSSLPSPDETQYNWGFCAVDRAIKSAHVLMALYKYDADKLSDMPPKGIMSVTGMTARQVREAIAMYKEDRETSGRLTFPGVLWLASAVGDVKVGMTPFSTLPEQFDREVIVTLYVYTLALDFGVDAREFWPATVTGATKADALIQAQKAKGKGPGELITSLERCINFHVVPDGCVFKFDFSDDEEDRLSAEIHQMKINNANLLVSGGLVSAEEARALLVAQRVLPETFAAPAIESGWDLEGHKSLPEDVVIASYKEGRLEGPFTLWSPKRAFREAKERTLEVDRQIALNVTEGSCMVVYEGDLQPSMDIVNITADGELFARVILQEARSIDGVNVGVVRTLQSFNPPIKA